MRQIVNKLLFCFMFSVLLLSGIATPVLADSSGPVIVPTSPLNGQTLQSGAFNVEARLSDSVNLDGSSVKLTINGQAVLAYTEFDLISIDPVTESEVYDLTHATVTYRKLFTDGTYNVQLTVKNQAGSVSTQQWSFTVATPPKITNLSPSPNSSVQTSTPTISAKISNPAGINTSDISMTLNGVPVPVFYNVMTGEIYYTPANPLPMNQAVNVVITVINAAFQQPSTAQWSFYVTYPEMPIPSTKSDCLKCHTNMPQAHPMSNCAACHDVALRQIYANSSSLPHFVAKNCYQCHNTANHQNGAIADVPAWWPIDQLYSCEQCHSHSQNDITAKHQTTSIGCSKCHSGILTQEHFRPDRTDKNGNPINCYTCHNNTNLDVQKAIISKDTSCSSCHAISHTSDHLLKDGYVISNPTGLNCSDCHQENSLVDLHINKKTKSGQTITCNTCHGSSDSAVTAAIQVGTTRCDACHSIHPNWQAKHVSTFVQNPPYDCSRCHNSNSIIDEHKSRTDAAGQPYNCLTCHQSTNPSVVQAISEGKTQCDACHNISSVHQDSSSTCTNCHADKVQTMDLGKYNFVQKQAKCQVCHLQNIGTQHYPYYSTVNVTINNVVYGGFKSVNSVVYNSVSIHQAHYNHKFRNLVGMTCFRCHGVQETGDVEGMTSCFACHSSINHTDHYKPSLTNPKTGLTISPLVTDVVDGYFHSQSPYYKTELTCLTAECHGTIPNIKFRNADKSPLCWNCHGGANATAKDKQGHN